MRRRYGPDLKATSPNSPTRIDSFEDYELKLTYESVGLIIEAGRKLHGMALALCVAHFFGQRTYASPLIFGVMWSALVFSTGIGEEQLRRAVRRRPYLGILVQHGILFVSCTGLTLMALWMPTTVMQHRVFCTGILSAITLFNGYSYAPYKVHSVLFCITIGFHWVWFHYAADFMKLSVFIYASGLLCYQTLIFHSNENSAKHTFESTRVLEQDREYLEKMEYALNGILCSLFDASCTVDERASILSCTPQFQLLLASEDASFGDGSNICDLAPCAEDANRLRSFVQQVVSKSKPTAETIQVTLSCASQSGSEREARDVKLYSIILPCHGKDDGESQRKQVFIGFQAADPIVSSSKAIWQESLQVKATPDEASHLQEDGDSEVAELPVHNGLATSSYEFQPFQHTKMRSCTSSHSLEGYHGLDTLTEDGSFSLELSETSYVKSTRSSVRSMSKSSRLPTRAVQDASTQTLLRPPLLPGHRPALAERVRPKKRKVTLNTSQRVLERFIETPRFVTKQLILQTVMQINPCGVGCCTLHVCLASLQRVIREMLTEACEKSFELRSDWQCGTCGALNQDCDDEDEDEDAARICEVCNTANDALVVASRTDIESSLDSLAPEQDDGAAALASDSP